MRTNIPVVVLLLNLFPLVAAGQEGKSLPLKTRTDTIIVYDTLYIHDTIKIEKPLPSIREYVRRVSAEVNNKNILPAFLTDSAATFSSSGILLSNKQSTMKRKTLLGITFALFLQALQAQSEYGVQGGMTIWKDVSLDDNPPYNARGINAGAYYSIPLSGKVRLSTGIFYSRLIPPSDYERPYVKSNELVKLYYRSKFNVLKIPLKVYFGRKRLSPFAGIGFNLKWSSRKTDFVFQDPVMKNTFEGQTEHITYADILFGFQYKVNKRAGFSIAYNSGIGIASITYKGSKPTIANETTVSPRSTSFEFSVFYSLGSSKILPSLNKKKPN